MAQYTAKVYKPNPDELAVASGGSITNDGTQASAIAAISESEAVFSAEERGKLNDILVALRGVGIIASS